MASALGVANVSPPELRSMLGDDVVKFDLAYERYLRQVAELNRSSGRSVIRAAGYKACVSAELLASMVMMRTFEDAETVESVTDEQVKTWVKSRSRCSVSDTPGHVKTAINKVRFKMSKSDPQGSVMQFFADVMTQLRRNRVGHVIEEATKTVILLIIPKLEPRQLRDEMQDAYEYWPKEKKTDFFHFMNEVQKTAVEFAKFSKKVDKSDTRSDPKTPEKPKNHRSDGGKKKRKDKGHAGSSKESEKAQDQGNGKGKGVKRNRFANWTEKCLNPECDQIHPLFECENTSDEMKDKLLAEYRQRKKKKVSAVKGLCKGSDARYTVQIEELIDERALGDNGSDESALSMRMLVDLRKAGANPPVEKFSKPIILQQAMKNTESVDRVEFTASMKVRISLLRIKLPCGLLRLRNVDFWVTDQDMDEVLLGRPSLKCIGFDLDRHLANVRHEYDNIDVAEKMAKDFNSDVGGSKPSSDVRKICSFKGYTGLWYDQIEDDPVEPVPCAGANMGIDSEEDINAAIDSVLTKAQAEGMSAAGLLKAKSMLHEFRDVLRIRLGPDSPAKLEPLRIKMRADAKPFRSTQRRYAPKQRAFLADTIKKLADVGAVYPNPKARWASPALAVPKPGSEGLRFTVDLRGPNKHTIPIASAMPDLEGLIGSVAGSKVFAKLDMCHAYWQIPRHEESRECMSIQTPLGVYTPTRILQGSTDAGNHFQSTTSQVFAELDDMLLQWLDDFLVHATSELSLLEGLQLFFELCRQHNLKLHARKMELFKKSAKFCGRIIDGGGVRYDPLGLEALLKMHVPERAGDLQQFICASNWMRNSIPNYSSVISPLHTLMEQCYAKAGRRTKRAVQNISLTCLWGAEHTVSFEHVKTQIAQSTKLAHPKQGWVKCLFSDASETHWTSLLSQVKKEQMQWDVDKQEHEPLGFLSGSFTGHSFNWSIVEKEGFSVVESMHRLDHLTASDEVSIFTDHSNLQYIFDPYGQNPGISKQVAHKLMRRALKLSAYRYVIEYLPGQQNVWADMLTRWALRPNDRVKAIKLSSLMYAPIDMSGKEEYDWPTRKEIVQSQERTTQRPPNGFWRKKGVVQNREDVFWVPSGDETLKLRLLIAAHAGLSRHRKKTQTQSLLSEHFYWVTMNADTELFCDSCIHCIATDSGERIPRPMGHSLVASKPNEVLHFDFCYIGESDTGKVYTLILKDGMSSYVRLRPCETTDAETAVDGLVDWFCTFSVVHQWVSDQGSHFKNELMKLLKERLRSSHHFTLPYCPWSNGTVEVVCRELTRCMRALLSEYSLPFKFWPSILPLVQSILNNTKLRRLGNRSPANAFMAMTPATPMTEIKVERGGKVELVTIDEARARQLAIERVHSALDDIHKDVTLRANEARERRVRAHNNKTGVRKCSFEVGDYVLRGILKTKKKNKLGLRWKRPMRVTRVLSDYLLELEDLCTKKRSVVHGTRIKFFRNKDYEQDGKLDEYLAFQEGEYCVAEEIQDIRLVQGTVEVLVKWKGFDDEEPQWESLEVMREDIPKMVSDFLQEISLTGTAVQQRLAKKSMS